MNTIFLQSIEMRCFVGIYAWEQRFLRKILIDIEVCYNNNDFVDYAIVSSAINANMYGKKFELIEDVALQVKNTVSSMYSSIESLDISVHKKFALDALAIGVRDIVYNAKYVL